jgi:hypothetical protein
MVTVSKGWGLTFRSGKPLPKSTVHQILRNPIYMGRFRWNDHEYDGIHEPVVPGELWQTVQDILDGRHAHQGGRARHEFVFSSLIRCGSCGCALVAEIKKGRYIYYHCTGNRGKCPGRYARQEVLEARFADALGGLALDEEVLDWLTTACARARSTRSASMARQWFGSRQSTSWPRRASMAVTWTNWTAGSPPHSSTARPLNGDGSSQPF